uniref:HeH/LEM domain-containing protein n=1 Tax=viral metagenome TaxID=1070528 RepID=A0A6C0I6M5_9ZZZZ
MDFLLGIVSLLAFVVLVLTVLVAWLYTQQSRLMQAVSALTHVITAPPPSFFEAARDYPVKDEPASPAPPAPPPTPSPEPPAETDDRVSVHDEEELLPPAEDDLDLGDKKVTELRELLTSKGIPYNKSDKKGVLLNLLKVAS